MTRTSEIKISFDRRQEMVTQYDMRHDGVSTYLHPTGERRAIVWPGLTPEGMFVVEYEDGKCSTAKPHDVRLLGSKERFDELAWDREDG